MLFRSRLFEAFKAFATADVKNGLSAANIDAQAAYAKMRLRVEIATANYSNEAGIQALLEVDPQIAKAVETMPQASGLVARTEDDPFR